MTCCKVHSIGGTLNKAGFFDEVERVLGALPGLASFLMKLSAF